MVGYGELRAVYTDRNLPNVPAHYKYLIKNMENYKQYAITFNANEKVVYWIEHTLANYLEKNTPPQDEVEHIIDYLILGDTSLNMQKMAYLEARKNAEKWVKTQQKKGAHIIETPEDTEVVLDFKDGFKVVKLIGENAYKREGFLMSNCVASYYGNDKVIYSLRDADNMPHCTMEHDQQIKGKGNGDIHPKYVGYVVKFLEFVGMTVGDNEMEHLGYVNILAIDDKNAVFKDLFQKKYFYKANPILDKDGKPYQSVSLWNKFNVFDLDIDLNIKWNFDVQLSIATFMQNIKKGSKKHHLTGNYSAASNTGDRSAASNTGHRSAASNTGDRSAALTTGLESKSSVSTIDSVAISTGFDGRAKGVKGSWLVLAERANDWSIKEVRSVKVDGKKIKENVWYQLKSGKFVEVST